MKALQDLYDHAPCGYLSMSPHGVVTRVNDTFLAWTGYRREEVLGKTFEGLLMVGSHIFYETRYVPVLRLSGSVRDVSLTIRRSDGRPLPILVSSTTRLGPEGEPLLVRTAIFDATERNGLERELLTARRIAEASEARVRVLQDASMAFTDCATEADLAQALATIARTAFRASHAAVMLADDAGVLGVVAGTHPLDHLLGAVNPRPEADAVRYGALVLVNSPADAATRYPGLDLAFRAGRIEAISVIPLGVGPHLLGVVVCFYGRRREFDDQARELHAALSRQATQVLERLRLQEELRLLALYDPLTGLANRQLLNHTLNHTLIADREQHTALALIFFDLDGFKAVNDERGHGAGDAVLTEIAQRLRHAMRHEDTIARFGGDEFVVLCTGVDEAMATSLGERIREAVAHPLTGIAEGLHVTASVGVALHECGGGTVASVSDMLRSADSAMYQSKKAGKNRVTVVCALSARAPTDVPT